jgi:GH25 family lysozyme M1 (1,4-beta-N-acetylmuramidase)
MDADRHGGDPALRKEESPLVSFSFPAPDAAARRRPSRRLPLAAGLVALLLAVLSFSSFAVPQPAAAASVMTLQTRCAGVGLRTSTSTSAGLKARLASGVRVTAIAVVTGGKWTTSCAGTTKSGTSWYRITAVNSKSVKSHYGVTYLYAATSLFKTLAVSTTMYAECANSAARTSASATSTAKVKLALGARVISTGAVTGGKWTATCPKAATGTTWYRVTWINGVSVKAKYGVAYLYVAKSALGTTAPTVKAVPSPSPSASATASPKPTPTPTPKPTPIPIGTPLPSQPNACKPPPAPTPTPTPSPTPTPDPSASASASPSPTASPAPTPTPAWNCIAGVDVSHWQGTIDWSKVAKAGYKFAYMKATEGGTYTDPTYATNRANANANGIVIGAYDFAQPSTKAGQAEAEADLFVKVAQPKPGDLVPVLDFETTNGLSAAALSDWTKRWMYRVYAKTGVRATIYVSPSFWSSKVGNTTWFALNGFRTLWIAHWTTGTSPTVPASNWGSNSWSFWQWSSAGTVPGISGHVDLDRFHYAKLDPFLIP